ncbi:MAG: NAD(P)H-dependent oxidoreductase [Gloeobacteraceae cyanobacterium ES-bin-316]|nr:NAD(P)H-dependent oxidoreductase [Ferruginibacter sp.]
MKKILILSSSIRTGKKSDRVALYFMQYIKTHELGEAELLDLHDYDFPLFKERLSVLKDAPPNLLEFAGKIKTADGIVLVAPEYNGGYPASLKNAIDVLYDEWKRKPIAISTVSAGPFAGMNMITGLQYVLWKIGALTVPALFPVAMVGNSFDEYGNPSDKPGTDKRAAAFLKELLSCVEAAGKMTE